MKLLALDTSTSIASVCLYLDGQFFLKEVAGVSMHASLILPIIEELLSLNHLSIETLDGIVFGQGPGSFTGLRIACSIAKGLGYAHQIPLFPVSCLGAIELATRHKVDSDSAILAMIDARMNEVYWSYFPNELSASIEQVCAVTDIPVASFSDSFVIAGVGLLPYLQQNHALQNRPYYEVYPSAQNMIELVLNHRIQAISAKEAEPIYIRNNVTHQRKSNG